MSSINVFSLQFPTSNKFTLVNLCFPFAPTISEHWKLEQFHFWTMRTKRRMKKMSMPTSRMPQNTKLALPALTLMTSVLDKTSRCAPAPEEWREARVP